MSKTTNKSKNKIIYVYNSWTFPFQCSFVTRSWWKFILYRNQSIDFQSKSIDWFLFNRNHRHERVNRPKSVRKAECFLMFSRGSKGKMGRKGLRRIFNLKYVHRLIFFSTIPFSIFHGVLHIIPEIYRPTNIYMFKINIETLEKGVEQFNNFYYNNFYYHS